MDPRRTARVYAGVDVSKDRLDVCVRRSEPERHGGGGGGGDAFFVTHDEAGIDALVSRLLQESPAIAILEATGGFERTVVGAFWPPRD